jgi:ribosome-binding factor A
MSPRRISRKSLLSACDAIGPGDGLDPRLDRDGPHKVSNRKALQLCGQIARALAECFPTLGDDVLRNLRVEAVTPAPNSSRLLVTVSCPAGEAEAARRLEQARGLLRTEVASAIHRKRTPDLVFRVRKADL